MRFSSQYQNLIYLPQYVKPDEKKQIFAALKQLYPIWETRHSESDRQLLRPVYWLGNWQFACLNYYHPPKGIDNRCVSAEPYPLVFKNLVQKIETLIRNEFSPQDVPKRWHLNTCLINYYGDRIVDGQQIDGARVGEHKDFEPGPVASISFGAKALFQFVRSQSKNSKSEVVLQQWLEDGSLQIFGGDKFKKQLFHRVQRVEDSNEVFSELNTNQFQTRRVNFTFRYVPTDHVIPLFKFPKDLQNQIIPYVDLLAKKSDFWDKQKQLIQP